MKKLVVALTLLTLAGCGGGSQPSDNAKLHVVNGVPGISDLRCVVSDGGGVSCDWQEGR